MLGYVAPLTVEEAISILASASGPAKVLSGGTDLLVQLRSGRTKPDLIVDIKRIPGISGIRERDGAFVRPENLHGVGPNRACDRQKFDDLDAALPAVCDQAASDSRGRASKTVSQQHLTRTTDNAKF